MLIKEEVAKYWNYDAETHTVTTDDGYILSLHHIWNSSVPPNGQVIYLQHGLLDTSFTWVVNLPHQSLGKHSLDFHIKFQIIDI